MMMKAVVLLCVAAVTLMVVEASSPLGVVYPFPIDTILTCRRPHPSNPGETVEVPTPTLPLVPGENDEVWLPPEVKFRPPGGVIDAAWLVPELPPPGLIDGIHYLHCPPPGQRVPPDPGSAINPSIADTINRSTIELERLGFQPGEQVVIMRFWDEVGFPDCDEAIFEITELPSHYFPPCFASGRCSGESCSLPEGQNCLPSPRNTYLLPVFRWDCCWDYDGAVWKWACGMYLVNIQIVRECYCACRVVY